MDLSHAVWRKSSYSGGTGGQCVEVAGNLPSVVAIRDSKFPDGPILTCGPSEWSSFVVGVKASAYPSK
ncbi:DUF397 domain-containing protein [Sphaerisporangium rubeum]|uniref:DUF397 domain-containing protein n=1 Tax=Sphaerisporangium rubeum TaxID=321317 RepID=A0A7X0ID33_9ACTN|nr:DUF397 domain-containing protein [Sphaerisporangium rubeum]MBB6473032.1 hypothetical protein [Sphaerisporangium rubeum]